MRVNPLKERLYQAVDARREAVIALGEDVLRHPELGFKERRTAGLVADLFAKLRIPTETGVAVTGVIGRLAGRGEGPTIAYMAEMDSVVVHGHPHASPQTGAAHACGHHAQIANLTGLAYGLMESGVMAHLDGNVLLMAVPAEEFVEIGYRLQLREKGIIRYLGGKQELIRLGALDDVDIVLATHQGARAEGGAFSAGGACNGCVVKRVRYRGKAAHAGGAPHEGINALAAATVALHAIDANRETFRDEDHIRVHPIMTHGGELVNVIPSDTRLEMYVRGATIGAIAAAAKRVDRSLVAGALAIGAEVVIETIAGYQPRHVSAELERVYRQQAESLVGEDGWWNSGFGAGSTDLGDVSQIMPVLEGIANGCRGTGHGADFVVHDADLAYVMPAKASGATIVELLANGAARAREVIESYKPAMTRQDYLEHMASQEALYNWAPGMAAGE
jgi:amidohydrolase